jgi:predicted glutamine amidotransferase
MCRLLMTNRPDRAVLETFRELSWKGQVPFGAERGHLDGWGLAWYGDGETPSLRKEASDPRSYSCARAIETAVAETPRLLLAHLRKASPGIPIHVCNSQPFVEGAWSFIHNGTLQEPDRLPLQRYQVKGTSDSERLFLFLLEALEQGETYQQTSLFRQAISAVERQCTYSALNLVLTNAVRTFVLCLFAEETQWDYYTLWHQLKQGWIVSSEPLSGEAWAPLENRTLLLFENGETFYLRA